MSVYEDAAYLESLLPQAISVLFYTGEADPLRHHTVGQIKLMRSLSAGSKTASELSHTLGLSPSSLTQMATRMIQAGLVSKALDPEDRRVRMLSLTPAGMTLMRDRQTLRARAATGTLDKMKPEEVHALIALLEEIKSFQPASREPSLEAVV